MLFRSCMGPVTSPYSYVDPAYDDGITLEKIKNEFDTLCGKDILKICNIAP